MIVYLLIHNIKKNGVFNHFLFILYLEQERLVIIIYVRILI